MYFQQFLGDFTITRGQGRRFRGVYWGWSLLISTKVCLKYIFQTIEESKLSGFSERHLWTGPLMCISGCSYAFFPDFFRSTSALVYLNSDISYGSSDFANPPLTALPPPLNSDVTYEQPLMCYLLLVYITSTDVTLLFFRVSFCVRTLCARHIQPSWSVLFLDAIKFNVRGC